ncbi:hypothetical protein HBA54_17880 [Pelagibius litoralis]|uniref:Protein kinase domain-containing protein n=1 Tax=Pelagibius litoralis TaxID=374515 RepID=A0A967KBN9_9PROT|nr:hypothetical protein [Pelagibius litoralis]NIA70469.1 hypothetical protein [Pelagibius litoralis]
MSGQTEDKGQGAENGGGIVMLADRYRLRPESALTDLNSPGVQAFSATDEKGTPRPLFALVCRQGIAARTDVLAQFSRFRRMPMMNPVRHGVVYWPPARARRFVIVFEQPSGERVLADSGATIEPWREDRVVRSVVQPLLPMFKELGDRKLSHRSIRADNLFFADPSRESVVVGECFSGPPGLAQPHYYEPIDSAMAMPEGRGAGTPADDFYALGVMMLVLLCGGNPVADLSEDQVVENKISKGSYAALVRNTRLSLPMVEVLRGLLCDDPEQRWQYDDLNMWLNGRHLSPKQALLPPKAARVFEFDEVEYVNAPALSHALGSEWDKALLVIKKKDLESWVRRSLGDDLQADAVRQSSQAAIGAAGGRGSGEDRLLSRVLMALDQRAPLRYKTVSARLDGLAQAFAVTYQDKDKRQMFSEIFTQRLPQLWIENQPILTPELSILRRLYDTVALTLSKPRIGYGLEKALYTSNHGWPCQSPLLQNDYVAELEDLLPALERVAQQGKTERCPVDKHIAGFISARMKGSIEQALGELGNPEKPSVFNLGVLRLLAEVQRAASPTPTPYLAAWCVALLKPVVEGFRNRTRREQMADMAMRLAGQGNLTTLLALIDDPNRKAADEQGFRNAKRDFAALVEQANWLRGGGMTSPAIVKRHAREASSIVSSVVAGVAVLGIALAAVI